MVVDEYNGNEFAQKKDVQRNEIIVFFIFSLFYIFMFVFFFSCHAASSSLVCAFVQYTYRNLFKLVQTCQNLSKPVKTCPNLSKRVKTQCAETQCAETQCAETQCAETQCAETQCAETKNTVC